MSALAQRVWLVESRSRSQRLLLQLYAWLKDNRQKLETMEAERSIFGLIVGSAFSLWRAAFLAPSAAREWRDILCHAEEFLEIVLDDNAINFPQDKRTRNWSVGYYLNNARYRLARIRTKCIDLMGTPPPENLTALIEYEDILRSGQIDEKDPAVVWDRSCDALEAAFVAFQVHTDCHPA